jgi:hypothetical protein
MSHSIGSNDLALSRHGAVDQSAKWLETERIDLDTRRNVLAGWTQIGTQVFGRVFYLIGKYGRHEETRTPDLYRVKAHLFNTFNILHHRWGPPKPFQMRASRSFDGLKNGLRLAARRSREKVAEREGFYATLENKG